MKYIKIHKEGYLILLALIFIIFVISLIVYMNYPKIIFAITTIISAMVLVFFAYFFRNPSRVVEIDDPSLVVAPADGTVVVVEPTEELEYFGERRLQVSIFMSVFNVHANWYPVAGKVLKSVHHDGNHMVAYLPKSSTENERSTVVIETPSKTQILVRQIAGALARRIVTYAHEGKECHLNEQMGFIKFGSRVDLYLPLDTEVFVQVGDKTTGNETIIARLNE
ncbi:phosphatidylserine decarboxylase family protein [Paludibacter sp. 221]|uniref:phosphatidylserine decarboxylase family protein n=1 Tax=Paludibacter sp. 221 TaxID=2302939 RepID=UPI0013D8BDA4|nr:phosphatidylserine decarboxylase family protein [Paludibacter sp. 221]NDV46165.1 phosphatidylserine decarboxylase family protein [Paludibacter sp. 221]